MNRYYDEIMQLHGIDQLELLFLSLSHLSRIDSTHNRSREQNDTTCSSLATKFSLAIMPLLKIKPSGNAERDMKNPSLCSF